MALELYERHEQSAKQPPRKPAAVISLLLCYAGVALMARLWTHSWSGWLVLGVAPALLLDKLLFRVLAPPVAERVGMLLLIRLGYAGLGVVGFTLLGAQKLTWRETIFLSAVVSLVTFLFEFVLEWGCWWMNRLQSDRRTGFHPLRLAGVAAMLAFPLLMVQPLLTVHPFRCAADKTPGEHGLAFEEVCVTTKDGIRLRGWYVPAAQPQGSVIYCHGYGENRGQVLSLLEPLHQLGLNVVALDFRGHGESQGHTVTFGHREVKDVLAACELARQKCPGRPLFLLGVSYGAGVVLQAAPQAGNIAALWIDSTFGRLSTVVEQHYMFMPEPFRSAMIKFHHALVWMDCGMWVPDINPVDGLSWINVPVYFCHGRSDPFTPFDDGKSVYEAYKGPKWHYWVPHRRDLTHFEHDKREYHRRLKEFFHMCLMGKPSLPEETVSEGARPVKHTPKVEP